MLTSSDLLNNFASVSYGSCAGDLRRAGEGCEYIVVHEMFICAKHEEGLPNLFGAL